MCSTITAAHLAHRFISAEQDSNCLSCFCPDIRFTEDCKLGSKRPSEAVNFVSCARPAGPRGGTFPPVARAGRHRRLFSRRHTQINALSHASKQAHSQIMNQVNAPTHTHARTHTQANEHTRVHTHTGTRTRTHRRMLAGTRTRTHSEASCTHASVKRRISVWRLNWTPAEPPSFDRSANCRGGGERRGGRKAEEEKRESSSTEPRGSRAESTDTPRNCLVSRQQRRFRTVKHEPQERAFLHGARKAPRREPPLSSPIFICIDWSADPRFISVTRRLRGT